MRKEEEEETPEEEEEDVVAVVVGNDDEEKKGMFCHGKRPDRNRWIGVSVESSADFESDSFLLLFIPTTTSSLLSKGSIVG